MAKHTNKVLCGLLALSAGFVLASCDTINALPVQYEEPVVERVGEGDYTLKDNQIGKIWEAIVSGKSEYIHSKIIAEIAHNQFGIYFSEKDSSNNIVERGLEDIVEDEDIKSFINTHQAAFVSEDDAKLAGSSDEAALFAVRKARFEEFKKDIKQRLAEKLYAEITSGNYNDKVGRFSELKLALAHYFSGYDIGYLNESSAWNANTGVAIDDTNWYKKFITSAIIKDDLDSITKDEDTAVIHIERYKDYLEKKVLNDIYSEKLIEEYILKNKYSTLGRAYARNVSYVKLSYTAETRAFANALLTSYSDNILEKASPASRDFEKVANMWRGIKDITYTGETITGLTDGYGAEDLPSGFTAKSIATRLAEQSPAYDVADLYTGTPDAEEMLILSHAYVKESKVGALFERYLKAVRAAIDGAHHNANSKDQSELDSFTGTNAHSRVKGLKDELSKLVLEDYTVSEWGLKNGGFSDLPSAIRERLFNINVANVVDNFEAYEGQDTAHPIGSYAISGPYSYVRYIYGQYYLNKADAQRWEQDHYSYIFDEDSSYVIVNIQDAANSTKLNVDHAKSYFETKANKLFTENTAREIAKLLGTKESYKTDAYQHYLAKYNLNFSDQELYDYFASTYPDLYGEDD